MIDSANGLSRYGALLASCMGSPGGSGGFASYAARTTKLDWLRWPSLACDRFANFNLD